MPQAFISHSTRDNKIVLEAADYLQNSLIKTWIDTSQLSGGTSLVEKIISGIKQSQYFFAFISQDYLQSDWCIDELRKVYPLVQKQQTKIIPVLLVQIKTIGGVKFQEIQFTLLHKPLPSDFLQTWNFDIGDFISENDHDKKPIRMGMPIAFFGISVNWLITYLAMPFKNKRTVFVFNQNSNDYICVFAVQDGNFPGKVLK